MRWLFDDHVLDVERRELRRAGALVAIEPQVFDLLVHLIRNRTRVVSKDDLLDAVWEGRIVSDSALANRINAARAAVGDNGEDQRVIRTLPRKGFRFVGSVVEETAEPVVASPSTNAAPQLVLPEQPSLVVLPFTDMSPDRNEGHFADGITEDLITELARIRWLFVIARNSAFTYKDRPVDVKQISRELGVRYVLEGSVRRSGQRMRINAQLVDATSGVHQWAERYDRDVGEIFAVQDEITSSVAAAVEPHLLVAEGNRTAYLSQDELKRLAARCSRPKPVLAAHERGFRCVGHQLDAGSREEPRLCPGSRSHGLCPGICGPHGVGGQGRADTRCPPPRRARHRLGRSQPLGLLGPGLCGDDAEANRGIACGISEGRKPHAQLRSRSWASEPWACIRGLRRRGDQAWRDGNEAEPPRSCDGSLHGRHGHSALHGATLRGDRQAHPR